MTVYVIFDTEIRYVGRYQNFMSSSVWPVSAEGL